MLSACGGEEGGAPPVSGPPPAGTPSPTPSPTPTPSPSPTPSAFPLKLVAGTSPVSLSNTSFNFYPNVAFGEHSRQTFDLFLPGGSAPSGLVIYFHGGGLVSGDKSQTYNLPYLKDRIDQYLWQNVAFATVNYRLTNDSNDFTAQTSFRDGARALQFIRHHAAQLNVDPDRVIAMGSSAGGTMALYIATSDDLAQPESLDLIERQSSRVRGAFAYLPQAGYNIPRWRDSVFARYKEAGLTTDKIYELAGMINVLSWLGLDDIAGVNSPEVLALRADIDILAKLTPDDPELYLSTYYGLEMPTDYATVMHHALHVVALRNQALSAGVPTLVQVPEASIDTTRGVKFYEWSVEKTKE